MFKKIHLSVLILALIIVGVAFTTIRLTPRLDALASNPNSFIRHFAPAWRSLKKIIDLPFVAFYAFRTTRLPIYELFLSESARVELLNNLPDYPLDLDASNLKDTVRGTFSAKGYVTENARIRYRGNSPRHWNAFKKSWQINLPDETPLGRRTTLRLVLPEDRGWATETLNTYRAKKLGVLSPELSYVRLRVNGADMGLYILMEGWEESFLEQNGRQFGSILANAVVDTDMLRPDAIAYWEDRTSETGELDEHTRRTLEYFLTLITDASDAQFVRELPSVLSMDSFYDWALVTTLGGVLNQNNISNQNLYLNPVSGRFEQISFDVSAGRLGDVIDVSNNRLLNRVLQQPKFRALFEERVRAYVTSEENLKDDLKFYDEAIKRIRPELLSDTSKLQTNFSILNDLRESRDIIAYNTNVIRTMLEENGVLAFTFSDERFPLNLGGNIMNTYTRVTETRYAFLQKYPQFIPYGSDGILLERGAYVFQSDVIVPQGLAVTIDPGTQLYFGPRVSFVSYSPVRAVGTALAPIIITARDGKTPWGTLLVANTEHMSIFEHVSLSYGSGATINGIKSTGMLAAHYAPITIRNSAFRNSSDDDALNVKYGDGIVEYSSFSRTFSDAVDFDFNDGRIAHNVFSPPIGQGVESAGGDAIDVSFSSVVIDDNTINGCGDKGMSVGERATPTITNNTIQNCSIGIAVKDGASTTISNTILKHNATGIALYRKKPRFEVGGTATIKNVTFDDNVEEITLDQFSSLDR